MDAIAFNQSQLLSNKIHNYHNNGTGLDPKLSCVNATTS